MSQYFNSDTSHHLYNKIPLVNETNSVRLLRLEPGRWSQSIIFTLHETPLQSAPSYTALSYAWINAENPRGSSAIPTPSFQVVQCNGAPIEVSVNLWAALRCLRDPKNAKNIWVDAICINQKDHQERNHQVGMMRKIYEKASQVLIWLGENGDDDDWGESLLPKLFPPPPHVKVRVRGNVNHRITWYGDARDKSKWEAFVGRQKRRVQQNTLNVLTRDIFGAFCVLWLLSVGVEASHIYNLRHITESVTIINGLQAIMEKSWWNRTWVVQETVVTSNAVLCYGNMTAPWAMFARAAIAYDRGHLITSAESVYPYLQPLSQFSRVILDIQRTRHLWKHASRPTTLLPLLRMFRTRQATDPRDKVFALLGIVQYWGGSAKIMPDYTLNREQVFWQTTATLIRNMKSLSVLSGTTRPRQSHNLQQHIPQQPRLSWVTDWSIPPDFHENNRLNSLRHYDASSGLPPGPVRCHGSSLLEAYGFAFDTIVSVASEFPLTDQGTAGLWRETVLKWEQHLSECAPAGGEMRYGGTYKDALWRTLCGDIEQTGPKSSDCGRATEQCEATYWDWRSNKPDTVRRRTTSIVGGYWQETPGKPTSLDVESGVASTTDIDIDSPDKLQRRNAFHSAVEIASGGRRLFVTQNGYTGTGPGDTSIGDVAVILYGSRVPFILRKLPSSPKRCQADPVENLISMEPAPMIRAGAQAKDTLMRAQQQRGGDISFCHESHNQCFELIGDSYVHGVMDGEAVGKGESAGPLFLV